MAIKHIKSILWDSRQPGRYARIDSSSHTLQTIDYAHHEIHSGSMFRVQHNIDAIPATGTGTGGEVVIAFHVPAGTKDGSILRLKNQGFYKTGKEIRGNQLVKIKIQVPSNITQNQKELLEKLKTTGL